MQNFAPARPPGYLDGQAVLCRACFCFSKTCLTTGLLIRLQGLRFLCGVEAPGTCRYGMLCHATLITVCSMAVLPEKSLRCIEAERRFTWDVALGAPVVSASLLIGGGLHLAFERIVRKEVWA